MAYNQAKQLAGRYSILTQKVSRLRLIPYETTEGLRAVKAICRERRPKVIGIYVKPKSCCEYTLLHVVMEAENPAPEFVELNARFGEDHRRASAPDVVIGWYDAPRETNRQFYTTYTTISEKGPVRIFARAQSPANAPATRTNTVQSP